MSLLRAGLQKCIAKLPSLHVTNLRHFCALLSSFGFFCSKRSSVARKSVVFLCRERPVVSLSMDAAPQRKRRKWDTAAPQGVPIAPGAPATASTASAAASNGTAAAKGLDAAAIARAQQGAAAVMAKINQVQASAV